MLLRLRQALKAGSAPRTSGPDGWRPAEWQGDTRVSHRPPPEPPCSVSRAPPLTKPRTPVSTSSKRALRPPLGLPCGTPAYLAGPGGTVQRLELLVPEKHATDKSLGGRAAVCRKGRARCRLGPAPVNPAPSRHDGGRLAAVVAPGDPPARGQGSHDSLVLRHAAALVFKLTESRCAHVQANEPTT
jgi:hypothetical protein